MRHSDPEGLYGILGITPDADQNEIKHAYRRLAKKTHPDTSAVKTALEFQRVYSAYKILSDRSARARYDRRQVKPQRPRNSANIKPVCCDRCGRVTAQPRHLGFQKIYGVVLVTVKRPVEGIFCASCARTVAAQATLVSSLLGWWALPLAPFHTIAAIYRNATGGIRDLERDEQLLWQNVQAFRRKGNARLSYALARKLQLANDDGLAARATQVVNALEKRGIKEPGKRLRNPWRTRSFGMITHLTMAAIVPIALAGAVAGIMRLPHSQNARMVETIVEQPAIATLDSSVGTRRQASTCWKVPENGEVLYRVNPHVEPSNRFDIVNDTSQQAIVKVRSAFSKRLIAAIFVEANASAELRGIPDGYFVLQYGFGDQLADGCVSFINTSGAWQFPNTESLRSIGSGKGPRQVGYSLSAAPVDPTLAKPLLPDTFNQN